MKVSDGLFLEVPGGGAEFPDVAFEDRIIDNLAMQLVQRPEDTTCSSSEPLRRHRLGPVCRHRRGLGVAPGVNLGDGCAVFEATHGTASRYRGLNRANPMALMLCGAMLLRHIGEIDAGDRLEAAVAAVIAEGRTVTYDLRPTGTIRARRAPPMFGMLSSGNSSHARGGSLMVESVWRDQMRAAPRGDP